MMNEHTPKLLTLPPYMHNSQFYTQSLLFLLLMTRFMIRKCSDMPGCIFSSFFFLRQFLALLAVVIWRGVRRLAG